MSDQGEIRSYLARSGLPILAREPFSPMLVVPVFPWWEYLMDVFRFSLVLVSRPVGRDEKYSFSKSLGVCVSPDQNVAWEERISLRPLLRSFCPGYPALP